MRTIRPILFLSLVIVLAFAFLVPMGSGVRIAHAAPPSDCTGVSEIPLAECTFLIALYSNTSGASWTVSTGWNTTTPCSTPWFGVICDGTNTTITGLNLSSNNLAGPLPATLGDLTNLLELDLHGNALTGTIPTLPANLITLNLHNNQLTGSFPTLPASLTLLDLWS